MGLSVFYRLIKASSVDEISRLEGSKFPHFLAFFIVKSVKNGKWLKSIKLQLSKRFNGQIFDFSIFFLYFMVINAFLETEKMLEEKNAGMKVKLKNI